MDRTITIKYLEGVAAASDRRERAGEDAAVVLNAAKAGTGEYGDMEEIPVAEPATRLPVDWTRGR